METVWDEENLGFKVWQFSLNFYSMIQSKLFN